MAELALRRMTADEFGTFRSRLITGYAADKVRAGDWSGDQAEDLAARQLDVLLPGGPATPGMLVMVARDAAGEVAGTVWVGLQRDEAAGEAWVFDIEVTAPQRGQGYGRALLAAAEREARRHGAHAIGLNVFGPNAVARSLYESSGYEITALQLRKELPGPGE